MADQHNDNIPAAGNQILNDVADIKENLEYHKDCFEKLCDGWSNTVTTNLRLKPASLFNLFTIHTRPMFEPGSSAYTVDIGGGEYWCKDKYCYWDSALTTTAIGTPSADTWYYLYLDYSAITTNVEITNTELIWSDTAPTFDHTYKHWLNGDDRCIFAVLTNGTPNDIVDFWHDGGPLVIYDTQITDRAMADLDNTPTAVSLTIPDFGDNAKALCTFECDMQGEGTDSYLRWEKYGASGTGHYVFSAINPTNNYPMATVDVFADSSQRIGVWFTAAGDQELAVYTNGFYFPRGL